MGEEIEIFMSYAREDEPLRQQLEKHLKLLQRQGILNIWYDGKIGPGEEYKQAIDVHLNTAKIILLLVSPDFINADYLYNEMEHAMKRHDRGEVRVIPIILRPIDNWREAHFGVLQALPTGAEPVTSKKWCDVDEAFLDVAQGIRKALELLSSRSSSIRRTIEFSIKEGNIQSFNADVVAVKYAIGSLGADQAIIDPLEEKQVPGRHPEVGTHSYVIPWGRVQARRVLIVGVPPIHLFDYQDIQRFTTEVLDILADKAPGTQHLAMTIHGTGKGPWNLEQALLAQFAGYIDAIQSGRLPPSLKRISVVENDHERVQRLGQTLEQHLASADYASRVPAQGRWTWLLTSYLL